MINEIYLKQTAYESLIRKSLETPESPMHLKATNAYLYLCFLIKQGKENAVQKQFLILKSYLLKAIHRLQKKVRRKSDKQQLAEYRVMLESVVSLSQIDWVVEQTLELIRPKE